MTPENSAAPRLEPEGEEGSIRSEAAQARGRLLHFPALPEQSPAGAQTQAAGRQQTERHSRGYLLGELLVLFGALPLAVFFHLGGPLPLLPTLWAVSVGVTMVLLRDPTFDRRQLWNAGALRGQIGSILGLFAAGVVVITALVWQHDHSLFLSLPKEHPQLWAWIMVSYPLASVYPQSLIFRAFFFHRYEPLLRPRKQDHPWKLILGSAAAFACVHMVFHNWIAVALTFLGGILFAVRYLESRSLCVSLVEHTLYGWLLFTIGLGGYFIRTTV